MSKEPSHNKKSMWSSLTFWHQMEATRAQVASKMGKKFLEIRALISVDMVREELLQLQNNAKELYKCGFINHNEYTTIVLDIEDWLLIKE